MPQGRWFNQSQPVTLQNATILLYINAAFAIFGLLGGGISNLAILTLAGVPAGFGMANDKRWGYYLAVAVATIPLALTLVVIAGVTQYTATWNLNLILSLMFQILLVALLLHKMSRSYQRIWFK